MEQQQQQLQQQQEQDQQEQQKQKQQEQQKKEKKEEEEGKRQEEEQQPQEEEEQEERQRKRLGCPYCVAHKEYRRVDLAAVVLSKRGSQYEEAAGEERKYRNLLYTEKNEDDSEKRAQWRQQQNKRVHEEEQNEEEEAEEQEEANVHFQVVDCFWRCFHAEQANLAVAAIHSLGYVVFKSKAKTALQLFINLRAASDALDAYVRRDDVLLYIHRISGVRTVAQLRAFLIEQAMKFAARIARSKQLIADRGKELFVKDHMVVLTHGRSSCVEKLLMDAWKVHHKRFSVIITRYDVTTCSNFIDDVEAMIKRLAAAQIPAVATSVSTLGEFINSVDFVIVGTEAVAGDGGVLNGMWSKVPLDYRRHLDYTRPELITLLFTDVGVFAPRYVTFEMSKLFGIL